MCYTLWAPSGLLDYLRPSIQRKKDYRKDYQKDYLKDYQKDYQKNYQKYYQKDHADIDVHDVVGVLRLLDPSRDRSEEDEEQVPLRGDGLQDAVHVLASFKELSQTSQ